MNNLVNLVGILVLALGSVVFGQGRQKPAPSPSRYSYSVKLNVGSLPKGVTLLERNGQWHIANASNVPLVINEMFHGDTLLTATKLVSGKVYTYFPNGVPMEGKTHLKGWQAPFGEIKTALLYLGMEPKKIYEGRMPGLPKDIPPSEAISIPAKYNGEPYEIKGIIHYHLNKEYDAYYRAPDKNHDK
ncbi:MAG TPA: hypothetical protein VJX74_08330 [Blastocatellia bacterium]|nr:hypothetical protein [Blastocatellia bacterium]